MSPVPRTPFEIGATAVSGREPGTAVAAFFGLAASIVVDPFLTELEAGIVGLGLLPAGGSCVVAVSGGLDSRVLLGALAILAPRHGWRLVVAHFNHRLRGAASDEDEQFVRRLAADLGLPVTCGGEDVGAGRMPGESPEACARRYRHAYLAGAARELGCDRIALGHQADDQVELFFLRLLRGAGGFGLGGMQAMDVSPVDSGLRLIRPLLRWDRGCLREAAERAGWTWREDGSNRDTRVPRNLLRQEVIPRLREAIQPALGKVVARVQTLLEDQAAAIEGLARDWLGTGGREAFHALPVAVQRDVVRLQLERLRTPVSFEWIEVLRTRPEEPVQMSPELRVVREVAGWVQALPGTALDLGFRPEEKVLELRAGVGAEAFGGLGIRWETFEAQPDLTELRGGRATGADRMNGGEEWMDAGRLGRRLRLRHWRPGDRFQPLGMVGAVKLQDLFTNEKVPAEERRARVVVEAEDGTVVWVEGLRLGESVRVTGDTRCCVRWRWQRSREEGVPSAQRPCDGARPA